MSTTISRLYNWVTDRLAGVKITDTKVDGEMDQVIVALNRKVLCAGSAPSSPIAGQTWVDTTNKFLKIYRNNEWVIMGAVHVSTTGNVMATPQEGDLWWDTTLNTLQVYNGASWSVLQTSAAGGTLGSFKNLSVTRSSATAVAVTADELVLEDTNNLKVLIRAVSETITITTSGASGLVAALSEAANTIYYIWIARKSSDGTVNGFLSTSATFATVLAQLDSGYDQLCLVSCVGNDNSSNLIPFTQTGRRYLFTTWAAMAAGTLGTWSGTYASVDLTPANMDTNPGFVPSALSNYCFGAYHVAGSASGAVSNKSTTTGDGSAAITNRFGNGQTSAEQEFWAFDVLTADTLYAMSSGAMTVYLAGFEINKLS